jgi:hypothetical protein
MPAARFADLPRRYKLTVIKGDTLGRYFRIRLADGTVADLPNVGSGFTYGEAKIIPEIGEDPVATFTTDNGGIVLGLQTLSDGSQWSGLLFMSAATTGNLDDWGDGEWSLKISDGVNEQTCFVGPSVLRETATP